MIIDEYECYMYKKKEEKGIFEYQSELDTIFCNLHEIDMHGKNIYTFSKIYIYILYKKQNIYEIFNYNYNFARKFQIYDLYQGGKYN